jgi:hypothetical protein
MRIYILCIGIVYILCARTPRAEEESDANRYKDMRICLHVYNIYNMYIYTELGAYPNPYIRVRTSLRRS